MAARNLDLDLGKRGNIINLLPAVLSHVKTKKIVFYCDFQTNKLANKYR